MNLKQQIVLMKLNSVTPNELLQIANEYSIPLTGEQAVKVSALLNGKMVNIFDQSQRLGLLKKVSEITSPDVARKVNEMFNEFMR